MSVADEVLDEIKDALSVLSVGQPAADMGETYERLGEAFGARGITRLLEEADEDGYVHNLAHAAFARRFFLRRTQGAVPTRFHAISRASGFFDALAIGADALAGELVSLSPTQWIREGEYEDDFCYMAILHQIVRDGFRVDEATIAPLRARLDTALEGSASARRDALAMLLDHDVEGFPDTLAELVSDRVAEVRNRLAMGTDAVIAVHEHVCIEGLGVLAIAAHLGFELAEEIPRCPSWARLPDSTLPEDIFADLERDFGL